MDILERVVLPDGTVTWLLNPTAAQVRSFDHEDHIRQRKKFGPSIEDMDQWERESWEDVWDQG